MIHPDLQPSHATTEKIRNAVYRTVTVVNDFLHPTQALVPSDGLALLGASSPLDSMGFINFIVTLEEELERELGRGPKVADLLKLTEASSVCTVADLIETLRERLA